MSTTNRYDVATATPVAITLDRAKTSAILQTSPSSPDGCRDDVGPASWLPGDPDGLVPMRELELPGPRRERENRGGATSVATTITFLIRFPLLDRLAALFGARNKVGRPTPPARYWLFYAALARELRSFEAADQELLAHWDLVRREHAALGIGLPAAKPGTANPVPGYHAFNRWRANRVLAAPGMLERLQESFTHASLELARLIGRSEGTDTTDPLDPGLGQILCGDATVVRGPSDVTEEWVRDPDGTLRRIVLGSRAKDLARARVLTRATNYSEVKKHGQKHGQYYVALSTKGTGTYTRVVLDVAMAQPGQAEINAAVPRIHRVLTAAPGQFQAVAYDGQVQLKHNLDLLRQHGVYVVNHNSRKSEARTDDDPDTAGVTIRRHGQYKDQTIRTYATSLRSQSHVLPDGSTCVHHLLSDDGALYLADRPAGRGTPKKLTPPDARRTRGPVQQALFPTALHRTPTGTGWQVDLEYRIPCPHGDLPYRVRLTDTKPDSKGSVAFDSTLGKHRVIPEACHAQFRKVYGARNQSESFFSWLEQRYVHKDRVASYEQGAQLLDLFAAAVLHNAEAWAHYAYRYGS